MKEMEKKFSQFGNLKTRKFEKRGGKQKEIKLRRT